MKLGFKWLVVGLTFLVVLSGCGRRVAIEASASSLSRLELWQEVYDEAKSNIEKLKASLDSNSDVREPTMPVVQEDTAATVKPLEAVPWYEAPSVFEIYPKYEDLATSVIGVDPSPYQINTSPTTQVSISYRKPIITPDAELAEAVTVLDEADNIVPGTLTISQDRTFLAFCAVEAYEPYSSYTTRYQAVQLEGEEVVRAFETSFETVAEAHEANAPVGVKPCDDIPVLDAPPHTVSDGASPISATEAEGFAQAIGLA